MGVIGKTAVSLRFRGDKLQPDALSALLRCQPDASAPTGGTWHTRDGIERIASTGMWHKAVARRLPGNLDGQVAELLALMTSDLAVWRHLTMDFSADVFRGLFLSESNQGLTLGPATLLSLGERGLRLDLNVYGMVEGR